MKPSNNSSLSKKAEIFNQKAKYQMHISNRKMVFFWAKEKSLILREDIIRTHLLYHNENCQHQSCFYYRSAVPKDSRSTCTILHLKIETSQTKLHLQFQRTSVKEPVSYACTTGTPPLLCSSDVGDNMVIRQKALLQQKVFNRDNGHARVAICRQQMETEEKEIIKLCIKTQLA